MSYKYKWKPNAAQRKEFAENMRDPQYAANRTYEQNRKREKQAEKKRDGSHYDYDTAGGEYVPTKAQYQFCMNGNYDTANLKEHSAINIVISGYALNEKVHHDNIHIINELMRKNS